MGMGHQLDNSLHHSGGGRCKGGGGGGSLNQEIGWAWKGDSPQQGSVILSLLSTCPSPPIEEETMTPGYVSGV